MRRCHGDLHLANIVLIEEQPVLFDAIEFDPTIASTDVLYDLVAKRSTKGICSPVSTIKKR
jgi:aminoglycoside phosphotransferase family enzyme